MLWIYALSSVVLVSLISLVGAMTLSLGTKRLQRFLFLMVGFSAGALIGDVFLHLLPQIVNEQGFTVSVSLWILAGISFSFFIEKIIHWHHCHYAVNAEEHVHPFAIMNLVGDATHNLIDGLIIGAAYLVSIPVGIATTVAVIFHEIPQEISDFGVLLHGGFSRKKALWFNFLVALTAGLGLLITFFLHSSAGSMDRFLIPFSAGTFIYIAAADLIPELHKEVGVKRSIAQTILFVLGIAVMYALLFVE